jgi:nitroreductase
MLDYGMFLQNVMLAARGQGLHTCPQAAWNDYHSIVLPHIGAKPEQMMVCGMSLGYADPQSLVNRFYTPRDAASQFTTWLD